jgi:hypothetical protein
MHLLIVFFVMVFSSPGALLWRFELIDDNVKQKQRKSSIEQTHPVDERNAQALMNDAIQDNTVLHVYYKDFNNCVIFFEHLVPVTCMLLFAFGKFIRMNILCSKY